MSLHVYLAAFGLLAGFLSYHFILHPVLISPLSKLPAAHWSCHFSSLWILRARKHGVENSWLQIAHQRLGHIVRVAPDTISVDGVDAMRTIYQGGFPKAPWYRVFDNYGVPCMFSTLDSKSHSRRKRMISNVYSKSYILSSEPARAQSRIIMLERLLPLLRSEASTQSTTGTEVQSLLMATTMDMISAYVLGMKNSTNFLQDKTYRDHWLDLYLSRHHHHFWPQELPKVTSLLMKIGIRPYPVYVDKANDELRLWNKRLCERAKEKYFNQSLDTPPEDKAEVFNAIQQGINQEENQQGHNSILYPTVIQKRDESVASEILDQVLAGHETAGIVLTYALWRLSKSPMLQKKLRQAILPLLSDGESQLPDARELDALPILNAIVMETLRLHAPIPGPQPRETPYPGCQVEGYEIPGGIRIASLAHTLHADADIFSEPTVWNPQRWLEGGDQDAMRRQFWAFGSGGRMCIGSNFALHAMKAVLATIYVNFTTRVVDDDGIEQTGGYSARPKADRLFLRFENINRGN